jgi:transketolase
VKSVDFSKCSHGRDAYGEALVEVGEGNPDVVVLDSDLSNSTKTGHFARRFPGRFFDLGIAEQNLIDVAAGLALCGKIPFVSTFAIFGSGRAWEQIRNTVALDNLHVNLVMTHAGLSLGGDGATHQSLEDIALMRVIPNMRVMVPADSAETREMVRFASREPGPKYIRLSRRRTLDIFSEGEYRYDAASYPVLAEGSDVTICTCGCMIRESLLACRELEATGISCRVINIHTVKPLSRECILREARKTGCIISVEEHSVHGGVGSAIAELLAEEYPVPMKMIGVRDQFGGSGRVEELYAHFGLDAGFITRTVQELVRKRRRQPH